MGSSISEERTALNDDGSEPRLVAHDMRNVLSGIQGYVALAKTRSGASAVAGDLEGIAAGILVLADLVSALDGGPKASNRQVTLGDMLRGLVSTWRGTAENMGLSISAQIEPDLDSIVLPNALRLGRLIGNLVSNAVRHGASGAGAIDRTGAVEIRARRLNGSRAELSVMDGGPGLPPSIVQALAEGGDLSRAGMRGSGLIIASKLARVLDLELALSNRREGGLEAKVILPVPQLRPAMAVSPAAEAPNGLDPANPRLDGLHILLAEDNVTNQMVARQMLEMLGARVSVVPDGAEALIAIDEGGPFDLLLVDIEMPRVSGLDVIRTVRTLPDARADLPVIALTAYAMPEHRLRIDEAGADGLIAKPIMGVREFGTEIVTHKRRRNRAAPPRPASPQPAVSPAPPASDEGPVERAIYDMLAQTIGSDSMNELLEKVESDLVDVAAGIAEGRKRGDTKLLRAKSHVLISVAGAIGAVDLQRFAERLNRAAHSDDSAGVEESACEIARAIALLIAFVVDERRRVANA